MAHFHLAWQGSIGLGNGQPIIATNIAGHAALLIVPAYSSLEAFDALSGKAVWSTSLPTQNQQPCGVTGIGGTAQYDATLGTVYVIAGNGNSTNHVVLYELNAATGNEMNSVDLTPVLVTGEATFGHTAVTLANGMLYAGTSSNCEGSSSGPPSWLGRIVAVNPSTMMVADTFYTTYGQGGSYGGGGVWAWGAVSADAAGNVYAGAGNAETNASVSQPIPAPVATTTDEQAGYAEHLIKLTSNLQTVEDSNYPGFNFTIGYGDLDYTGVPVLWQPVVGSGCTDLMSATQGKGGVLEINDTTSLNPPVASYALSVPSGNAYYIGNPGYSPVTGYLYAAIASSGNGSSMLPPGMAAISSCGTSMAWHAQFGSDSAAWGQTENPRSAPTVTAGGVAFMGTPCTSNGNGGCDTPNANVTNGALWAVDAASGALLGSGGNPLLVTGDNIRMAPSADGLWIWVCDDSGNLYAYTVDPSVPAAALRPAKHFVHPSRFHELK